MPGRADTLLPVGRDTIAQQPSSHHESGPPNQQQQADDTEHEPVTLEILNAEEGLGPAADLLDCTFHASTEDFLASLESRQNSHWGTIVN